jgi:hypothetical protein
MPEPPASTEPTPGLEVLDGGREEVAELIAQRLREWKLLRTHSENRVGRDALSPAKGLLGVVAAGSLAIVPVSLLF